MNDDPLPAPAIPSARYTERYYRRSCFGADAFRESGGRAPDAMYAGYARHARIAPGETLVDLGCGRGELLVAAVHAGAARAVGVEYAEAAVALAAQTIAAHGIGERAELHHADARQVPVGDGVADVVTLMDVVEHLTPAELHRTLGEARRVLRPGGRLLIHTFPNRNLYAITYRLHRFARRGGRHGWPVEPRNAEELAMHVNEMTRRRLQRALRDAGFPGARSTLGAMIHAEFVPDADARVLYHRLAAHRPTAWLARADLWAHATRP